MNKYLVLISSLSLGLLGSQVGAMSMLEQYLKPSSSRENIQHKPLTKAERLERRKSTVDYWKTISRLVDKAGISKDDLVYKRTHANLARAESRLQNFGKTAAFGDRKSRKQRQARARAVAARKGAERRAAKKDVATMGQNATAKAASTKAKAIEAAPQKKSFMERMFGVKA